ncbi:MAG: hypothetical protein ACTSQL_06250, partial [Promethearchaeota archaeon]
AKLFLSNRIQDFLSWITVIAIKIAFKMVFKSIIGIETLFDKEGIKKFTDLVSNDKERRRWLTKFMDTTVPMSLRKLGLNHDIELLTSIEKIPVDNINVNMMWVGEDMDKIKSKRIEFLKSIKFY